MSASSYVTPSYVLITPGALPPWPGSRNMVTFFGVTVVAVVVTFVVAFVVTLVVAVVVAVVVTFVVLFVVVFAVVLLVVAVVVAAVVPVVPASALVVTLALVLSPEASPPAGASQPVTKARVSANAKIIAIRETIFFIFPRTQFLRLCMGAGI